MTLLYTILIALPLGYFVKSRSTAVLAYLLAGSYLFSYQSTIVLLDWFGHESPSAFGPFPNDFPAEASSSETLGYGAGEPSHHDSRDRLGPPRQPGRCTAPHQDQHELGGRRLGALSAVALVSRSSGTCAAARPSPDRTMTRPP